MFLLRDEGQEPRWGAFLFATSLYVAAVFALVTYRQEAPRTMATPARTTMVQTATLVAPPLAPQSTTEATRAQPAQPSLPPQIMRRRVELMAPTSAPRLTKASSVGDAPPDLSSGGIALQMEAPSLSERSFGSDEQVAVRVVPSREGAAGDVIGPLITFQPPVARKMKGRSGEVVLAVLFRADGTLTVERVLHSVGREEDLEATRIALGMRFIPAHRGEQAVDFVLQLHITFA